jgi:hypothetical protein
LRGWIIREQILILIIAELWKEREKVIFEIFADCR